MDNRPDIWRRLKDHEIPPPAEVADGLRLRLDLPGEEESSNLRRLQDHSIPPPSFLRSALAATVNPPKRNRYRSILPYAAAACLLLIIIGVVVDRAAQSRHPGSPAATAARAKDPRIIGSPSPNDTATSTNTAIAASGNATDSSAALATAVKGLPLSLGIGDARFALVDNNPLATFTSFKYPALKEYIDKRSASDLRLHLDQYTNIVLSPAMADMIKDLYDTRPNGLPGRKARKTKEKLDKWKAADEKEFDGSYRTNPLDPVDLAEFIFPSFLSFGRHSGPAAPPPAPALNPSSAPSPPLPPPAPNSRTADSPGSAGSLRTAGSDDLTVSYTLTIVSKKANNGIGETYNGGIETLLDGGDRGRLRLASLMRIQSIFLSPDRRDITVLAESARHKTKTIFSADQWSRYNGKYAGAACNLNSDTALILGYTCKKALITLKDGRRLTAWYTPHLRTAVQPLLEPAFASLPGLVLRYEYTCRHKTVRYTASALSRKPIDESVFHAPATP